MARPRPRWSVIASAAALLLGFVLGPSAVAHDDAPRARLEAEFLVNFVRFTQWPHTRFDSVQSPYVVTVVGSDEVAAVVREVADAAGLVHGRRISVRRVAAADVRRRRDAMRASHVLFVHESADLRPRDVLEVVKGTSVLTVGDSAGFARAGGMLKFVDVGSRLTFVANPEAIQSAGLSVSAKVLKLAKDIET